MRKFSATKIRIGAALTICALALAACGESPESTVKNFYRAVEDGKIEKALEYVDPNIRQVWGGKLAIVLAAESEKIRRCGGIKSIETEVVEANGDRRVVKTTIEYKNSGGDKRCNAKSTNEKLVKMDGKWRFGS
mgnify:CR=1 FL=1